MKLLNIFGLVVLTAALVAIPMMPEAKQRQLAESTSDIPVGSCFPSTGQCWDGHRWAPKPAPFVPKSWQISDQLPVYVVETEGACIYVIDYNSGSAGHSALAAISKKDLLPGKGC